MKNLNNVGEHETQKDVEKHIKECEAEEIALIEEKLEGLKLAYGADSYTVPITKVAIDDLLGVTMQPWESFWEHDKIDLRTPIILGREKNVIAGPYQYFEAKESGLKEIDAVYIDSLKRKKVSVSALKKQFKDKNICFGFAYSLYALLHEIQYVVPFCEFCNNFDEIFEQGDIHFRIYNYILALDEEYGG